MTRFCLVKNALPLCETGKKMKENAVFPAALAK
jgi:hypothetical protein